MANDRDMFDANCPELHQRVEGAVTRGTELPARAGESRTLLWDVSVGLVENLSRERADRFNGPDEFSPKFQVCLPYRGILIWHVGGNDVVGDANQVLFVTGGEGFRISSPTGAYAELIITPHQRVLSELAASSGVRLEKHPLFARRSRRAPRHLQTFRRSVPALGDARVA